MRRFRTIWKFLTPGWLQRGEGELIQYALGFTHDAFAERCRQTVWLMLPSLAPNDALDRIGRDRGLPRGIFEPASSYRDRLKRWRYPLGHRIRGTATALLDQIAVALRGSDYRTIDQRGTQYTRGTLPADRGVTWDWDGSSLLPDWARYWVVVKSTGSLPTSWDDTANLTWDDDAPPDECWAGEDIHPGELEAVISLVKVPKEIPLFLLRKGTRIRFSFSTIKRSIMFDELAGKTAVVTGGSGF